MDIYAGSEGVEIRIKIENLKISELYDKYLIVKLPNGNKVKWYCDFDEDTNELIYVTKPGDLDNPGKYSIQPYIETNGFKGRGSIVNFFIKEGL